MVGLGVINTLHASLHIIQFIQSVILVNKLSSSNKNDSFIEHPVFIVIWAIIGIITLVIGIRDFIHHKNCNH